MKNKKVEFYFLLLLAFMVSTGGCAVLSKSQEKEMGQKEAEKLEEEVGIYQSGPYRNYVQNVGRRIAVYSDRSELRYEFEILDTFLVNALALPGGFVYVTRGLLKELETEAELAGVLAHELGHVNARHAEKRRQIQMATLLAGLAAAPATGGQSIIGGFVGQDMMARGYTREAEYEADELGFKYMITAGYKPRGLIDSLKRLQELSGEIPDYQLLIFRTHPYLVDRMRQIDLQQLEHRYAADTQLIDRKSRYQRYRRRYLFQGQEKEFTARLADFLDEYESLNVSDSLKYLHEDFEFEHEEKALEEWLENKFEGLKKIDYTYRLQKLDVGDTEATVVYTYREKMWETDKEYPRVNSGYQKMSWQRADERWKLMKLR